MNYKSLLLSAMMTLSSMAIQAIIPDSLLQQKMQAEENTFLANMKPGLQHTQMLAVRKAIQGDDTDLQQIRQSRNVPPTLPDEVSTHFPTSDLCVFTPKKPTSRKRPVLLYLHGGGWCFGSINS